LNVMRTSLQVLRSRGFWWESRGNLEEAEHLELSLDGILGGEGKYGHYKYSLL